MFLLVLSMICLMLSGPEKVDHKISVYLQNIEELKTLTSTRIPVFDFEKNKRSGSKELVVSEDCAVVSLLS